MTTEEGYTIRLGQEAGGVEATVFAGEWASADPRLEALLRTWMASRPVRYAPDPDALAARQAADMLGGELVTAIPAVEYERGVTY